MDNENFPLIEPVFASHVQNDYHALYVQAIKECIRKVLPRDFFCGVQRESVMDVRNRLLTHLPIIKSIPCSQKPENLSFFMLSRCRPNVFKFFFDMFSGWLLPGKRLNVTMLYSADFRFPEFGNDVYTICEILTTVKNPIDLSEINVNLPIIEMEARLGIESEYFAQRILEIKGLTADEKIATIQEYVARLIRRLPKQFERDIFTEVQHVMVICPDDFKGKRDPKLLSRIICTHYSFRRELLELIREAPERRHLRLRIFRSKVRDGEEVKDVLSVLVGINFLQDKEVFDEQHLLKAIQDHFFAVSSVKNSFFANQRGHEHITTVYLEVEKNNGESFSLDDIKLLRKELVVDLRDRIGYLMHPVFMPRNEEEIMRNVLTLSSQIKYIRDFPQVFISFDEQTHAHLFFTVILVRILAPGCNSIQMLFHEYASPMEYIHDRSKMVGMTRKKYVKEATVFRVKIVKQDFIRQDHSIDLYKAREAVVDELTRIIGPFRDFNGGMISKQNELLCALRELLASEGVRYNDLLLEKFFYSLSPVIMRTVLEPEALKILFKMLLKAFSRDSFDSDESTLEFYKTPNYIFVMIINRDSQLTDRLDKEVNRLIKQPTSVASSSVQAQDVSCVGYIYRCDEETSREQFCSLISKVLEKPVLSGGSV